MNPSPSVRSDVTLSFDAAVVRRHYDSLSFCYRLFWGEHLHHGWFKSGTERPREAQLEMLWQCVSQLRVPIAGRALDVGCGYGATSLFLASELACQVDGLSLSPNQLAVANRKAGRGKLRARVKFHLADAESFAYPRDYYDLVWTMESSEHFTNKQRYFQQVSQTLHHGGKLLLAAWTGSMAQERVRNVAEHFLCPELCTAEEYVDYIEAAGMQVDNIVDATRYITPTWQICVRRAGRFAFLWPIVPAEIGSFVRRLDIILEAYLSGDLTYTIIAAHVR